MNGEAEKSINNVLVTNGKVEVLKDKNHFNRLVEHTKNNSHALFFDFTATWCGPCKMMTPIFEKLADTTTNAVFVKVDVDKHEQVAALCKISAMPTFQCFKNGENVASCLGANKSKLEELVKNNA